MKLQEFFNEQKHTNFTDVDKLDLYQSILYKKTKKASLKRFSFVPAKYAVYTMIFVFLLFGIYGVYFINNGSFQDYNRFSIIKNGTNTANADYIAQVIDAKGNFYIEHDGVLTKTNNIGNGDTILIKEWAQLAFEINSGAQSKIIGPAKLIIQQTHNENYKLNLVYGDFITMEGNERKVQNIELTINDITLKQEDKTQPLSFEFIKDGENQIIKNNGANIIVTKSNGADKTTNMGNKQVLAIQENDIKLFANFDNFSKAVENKDISQTFALATPETKEIVISWAETSEVSLLNLLSTTTVVDANPEVTKDINETLSDGKKILDPKQDEKISASLYTPFFMEDIKEIEAGFVAANETSFTEAFNALERKIIAVYQTFGLEYTKQAGDATQKLQGLKAAIATLEKQSTTTYNVPPTYTESLQTITKNLGNIITKGYGSSMPQKATETIETAEIETAEKVQ